MAEKIRVMLVDDDEDDYLLTAGMLTDLARQTYELEWISTAAKARARLAAAAPDICLLDYRLGADDGISLISEFQAAGFDGPIIMLTGQRDRDLENQALAAGAVDYLSKQDIDAHGLERALRYAWMRRKAEMHEYERIKEEARRREAEAANQAKSEFLAYISHELRTPLAALLSYSDLLSLQVSGGKIAEYTSAITRNGRHLQALLDDMVDLSLIESSKLELEITETALKQVIVNVVSIARVQCQSKSLEFILDLPHELPEYISTDKKRLTQMLFNLLGNAIKFTEAGSVTFRLNYQAEQGKVVFDIEDTGPGIREEDIDRIFEPFYRLNASKEPGSGIGLGLTITTRLAENLGASIDVRSRIGVGTCFTLSLPANDVSALKPVTREELLRPDLAANLPDKLDALIAIVDDAEDIRNSLSGLLQRVGARVIALSSGDELLRLLDSESTPPELILLDMQMPGLDGYQTAQAVRARGVDVPIVALTAAAFEGARERCIAAGCDDYLSKPAEPTRLLRRIADWLDASRNKEETVADDAAPRLSEHTDILVVDDDRDGREAMRELLELLGYTACTAASEEEAESLTAAARPQALILDINLGAGSGIALAQRLRAAGDTRGLCIIGLSGRMTGEFAADELALFDAFMTKPAGLDELTQKLADCGIRPQK